MTTNSKFWMIFLTSLLPIGNGLQYFIGGEVYRNTDLRNYAVIGQILFGLVTMAYSLWLKNHSSLQDKEV